MPRKQCFWTRKLELDLVEFVKQREFIWKPAGNTNHDIQLKYKAYAEFAAILDLGFTARAVRDRWVNIRSTFNHYLRRLEKSKQKAQSPSEVYVPCWPLWKPLQFLLTKRDDVAQSFDGYLSLLRDNHDTRTNVKDEVPSDLEDKEALALRQRSQRTDRPRARKPYRKLNQNTKTSKCKRILDDLLSAMRPLKEAASKQEMHSQSYWFFGKHVSERLNSLGPQHSESAGRDIMRLLEYWPLKNEHDTPT